MTAKGLKMWSIATKAITAGGVAYALYEIGQNGQVVGVSDVNLDGVTDEHRIDVNNDNIADYHLNDTDFDGQFDQLSRVNQGDVTDGAGLADVSGGEALADGAGLADVGSGEAVEVLADGGILEVVIGVFAGIFG